MEGHNSVGSAGFAHRNLAALVGLGVAESLAGPVDLVVEHKFAGLAGLAEVDNLTGSAHLVEEESSDPGAVGYEVVEESSVGRTGLALADLADRID